VLEVRTTVTNALEDPVVLEGWKIPLDGDVPDATPADFDYADRLD
jgi:hypothetical protein